MPMLTIKLCNRQGNRYNVEPKTQETDDVNSIMKNSPVWYKKIWKGLFSEKESSRLLH